MGERNDLIERLLNPLWAHMRGGEPHLDDEATLADLKEAADTIAILSEALAEAEKKGAEGWQPIETAPRDGTEFIAYREDQGSFACRWMTAEELAPKNQDGDLIGDHPEGHAGWWHDVWGWLDGDEAPTLWQSYPAPPRDLSQGGQHG